MTHIRILLVLFVVCSPVLAATDGLFDSVFDYAESIVDEVESNDTPATAQDLTPWFSAGIRSVGIPGAFDQGDITDIYAFTAGQAATLDLRFELLEPTDKNLTALAAGPDALFFVADGSLWSLDPTDADAAPALLVHRDDLPAPGVPTSFAALTSTPDPSFPVAALLTLQAAPTAPAVVRIGTDRAIDTLFTEGDLTALTDVDLPDLASIAADPNTGRIYLLDRASASILRADPADPNHLRPTSLAYHVEPDTLAEAIKRDVLLELQQNSLSMPRTVLAEIDDDFQVNSLVYGAGDYATAGLDTYYLSQLGPDYNGDGSITRVTVDPADPNNFTFTRLFEPNDSQQSLNPSALAIDDSPSALFGGQVFMGTFGPSLGDDFDGQIYIVSPQGQIAPFITAFVDDLGQPAFRNGLEVTGLFDVTDMAFPPSFDGPFGPYLYVLSENIDQNGSSQAGGFSSDLWRVAADGTAELFVENFADGVISLAFGSFAYGNDLFVATFQGGKVYRVTPAGDVDLFYDFSVFSSSLMASDVVFTPPDLTLEPMADALLLSLVSGNAAFLVQIQPNGLDIQIWGSGFATGDVSSGDLLFNPEQQLVLAQQEDKNLVRVDYENLLDTRLDALALRREVLLPGDPNETITYAPYLLATVGNRPRVLRLGDGQLDSIQTESRPVDLFVSDPPEDTLDPLKFTFDPDGQLIAWMPLSNSLQGSTRANDAFNNFFTGLTGEDLAAYTSLVDPYLVALAVDPAGTLYTLARNADSPDLADEDLTFDDRLLALEPGQSGLIPRTLLEIPALTRALITLAGPGDPNIFDVVAGEIVDVRLENQPAGDYLLQLDSVDRTPGNYELLVGVDADFSASYTLTAADTPRTFTTIAGDRLDFVLTGSGQATLQVDQRSDGTLIALHELDLTGTRPDTELSFVNRDNPGDFSLDTFSLDGSLQLLDLEADLRSFDAPDGSRGIVKLCHLGHLRSLDAPNHSFQEFHVAGLGEPDAQNLFFDAARLTELYVTGDVEGIQFFSPGHRNIYRTVVVDGRVVESVFYGLMLLDFRVRNLADADVAFDVSALDFRTDGGRVRHILFDQGDVVDSFLAANRAIDYVELSDGNLTDTSVSTIHSSSSIGDFFVLSDAAPGPDSLRGNITGAGFSVYRRFDRLHADGNIDENTSLYFRNTFAGKLNELSSAGHCAATLGAGRIFDILVGYDRNGIPLPESDSFTGSDFSGSASVIFLLKEINVTGAIRDASLATTYPGVGYIGNVYAQDGCLDSNLSAERTIRRIMIGYEDGNRRQIMNLDADVSGTIATRALGRLYYTGSIDDLTLDVNRNIGPVHDDNPDN